MTRFWTIRLALAAALAGAPGALRAQTLIGDLDNFAADTGQYNLLAFGNVDLEGSSDTQGGIAVGGNLTIGGSWTIASQTAPGSNPALYLNGSLSLSGTTHLNNGYAATPNVNAGSGGSGRSFSFGRGHGGGATWNWDSRNNELYTGDENSGNALSTANSSAAYAHDNPVANPTPQDWDWSSLQSSLEAVSSDLGGATANGTISVSGQNLVFSPPSGMTSGVAVFTLDASQLSGDYYGGQRISNIQINVPSGIDYVINVINLANTQTLFGSGINFNSGANDDQLLWNFVGDQYCDPGTSVTIGGGGNFYGSVLAPGSTVTASTTINGQVVANDFTDTGVELHDAGFNAVQVLVPEAGTFAWWALALCGAAVLLRRRRIGRSPLSGRP
jgi:choice-of-anchor A domain-containing protein